MYLNEIMQYKKQVREYNNEKYIEYTCPNYNTKSLIENENFIKDVYSNFNKEPLDLKNNNYKAYRALFDYTDGASQIINSQLHFNEELIKNSKHIYSDEYFEIRNFLKEYYIENPIITYRIISEKYINDAINEKNFFKGLVSTGCVLNSLKVSSGSNYSKTVKKAVIRIFVPKKINCIMLPKSVTVCPEEVEILILDGYKEYKIEETKEICELKDYAAKVYNLYLKEPN